MTLRVLDIETTGVDPVNDAIVEIASVDIYKTPEGHDITSERETYVHPGRPIPPESSAVHHIIDSDVASSPRLRDVIGDFATADAFVAHSCAFERGFLDPVIGEQKWACTFKCALRIWPEAPGHSNQVLRYWLGLIAPFGRVRSTIAPHRALSDVIITAAIFVELCKKATWSQMVSWTQQPALYTKLTFGKHKGMTYAAAPADYLEWIAFKSELDADTKYSAEYWLQQRKQAAANAGAAA